MLLNFGSAIMGPEVYLKALAMARNVAHQEGRAIRHFTTAVFDLVPIQRRLHARSCPRPIPAITSARTRPSWSAPWPMAARASISAATIAPPCPPCGALLDRTMTTAEILAAFPEAPRAGGRRHLPGPLVHATTRRWPSPRARPASRASAWFPRRSRPAPAARWPITWPRWARSVSRAGSDRG